MEGGASWFVSPRAGGGEVRGVVSAGNLSASARFQYAEASHPLFASLITWPLTLPLPALRGERGGKRCARTICVRHKNETVHVCAALHRVTRLHCVVVSALAVSGYVDLSLLLLALRPPTVKHLYVFLAFLPNLLVLPTAPH